MIKMILLDADGVVIKKIGGYFSDKFVREYGAPADDVRAFFKNVFPLCQVGKADLIERLEKKLPAWGWKESTQEFLKYWFSDIEVDDEVLVAVQKWRSQGVQCYLATDQEEYRSEYIVQKLLGKLDGAWFSCDLGYSKSQPEFFQEIIRRWDARYRPQEILYFDDEQENVDSARAAGINAHLYTSIEDLKQLQ